MESSEKLQEDLFSKVIKIPKFIPGKTNEKKEKKEERQQDYSKWLSDRNLSNTKTISMPEKKDLAFPSTKYEDAWIWGQINRIFPIKVGSRILAIMQKEKGDFIALNDFHKKAGEIARGFGSQLERIDNQFKRKRDDRVSIAFPIGENEEKAIARYISQFLAIKRANGILDGAMARLKFVNIHKLNEKEELIGLTKEGLEFTKLINPLLDEDLNSERTLSDEEIDFYLKHIANHVPEELNPFKHILQILKNGASSGTEIDKELKKIKPEWTDILVTTQRSGALGRMSEFDLLNKTKKGVKATYKISEKGENFLTKLLSSHKS